MLLRVLRASSAPISKFSIPLLLVLLIVCLSALTYGTTSISAASTSGQVPFEGMRLAYYSETTPTLLAYTGIAATGWVTLQFHDVTSSSSLLDISVNGTVTEKGQQAPVNGTLTVNFPTDQDTLLYLRNGGQQDLMIYAGPVGQSFQIIPGYSFDLTRSWNLLGESTITTPLATFSTYRYHTAASLGETLLDFYAYYERTTQLLVYGEVYATQGAFNALVEKISLRQENVQFSNTAQTPQCIIATAAYGSELAAPVQFLLVFRDQDVQGTYLGGRFVSAFNAWYYSWAPSIARVESVSSTLRAVVRVVIMPLLGALFVSASIFGWLRPISPELGVLISGIVASALIGFMYLTPLAYLVGRATKRKLTGKSVLFVTTLGIMLTLLGTITHGTVGIVENLTTLTVIESMLLAPTLVIRNLQGNGRIATH